MYWLLFRKVWIKESKVPLLLQAFFIMGGKNHDARRRGMAGYGMTAQPSSRPWNLTSVTFGGWCHIVQKNNHLKLTSRTVILTYEIHALNFQNVLHWMLSNSSSDIRLTFVGKYKNHFGRLEETAHFVLSVGSLSGSLSAVEDSSSSVWLLRTVWVCPFFWHL